METIQLTTKEYFRTLAILHIALILGQVLFAGVVVLLVKSGVSFMNVDNLTGIFLYLVPITGVCGLLGSILVYKNKVNRLKGSGDLKTKMTGYRTAMILRYAIVEVPSFISIIAVMLTGNFMFFLFTGFVIMLMAYWRPSKETIISDLQLDYKEMTTLEDPKAIIAEFEKAEN
jgi:hypothetical protein